MERQGGAPLASAPTEQRNVIVTRAARYRRFSSAGDPIAIGRYRHTVATTAHPPCQRAPCCCSPRLHANPEPCCAERAGCGRACQHSLDPHRTTLLPRAARPDEAFAVWSQTARRVCACGPPGACRDYPQQSQVPPGGEIAAMQRLERLSVQSETVVRSRQFRAQQRAGGRRGGLSRSLVSTLLLLLVRSPLVLRRSGEAPPFVASRGDTMGLLHPPHPTTRVGCAAVTSINRESKLSPPPTCVTPHVVSHQRQRQER
jgi:hypothetical protein